MGRIITDMETWLLDNDGRVFRFLVYKKMYTPYEQERKFIDESQFEDTHYRCAFIEEAIELANGEWLLGFREILDGEVCGFIEYYKLSDIQLACFDDDQDMILDDAEFDEDGDEE